MGTQGRTVVVTGASSGIGRCVAEAFASDGANVALISRNEARLQDVVSRLGAAASAWPADVSDRGQVLRAVDETARRYGTIDVLVNCAAATRDSQRITTQTPLEEAERNWDLELAVSLKGAFLMAMAVAPHLRRPGGRIINISSIAAYTGGSRPGSIAYATAKAGLHGLTYALARELSPQGITVNAIAPGFIAGTGLTVDWPTDRTDWIVSQVPVSRPGQVNDVASAVLYLASPEASFITGEILNVNGGWIFGH